MAPPPDGGGGDRGAKPKKRVDEHGVVHDDRFSMIHSDPRFMRFPDVAKQVKICLLYTSPSPRD